MAHFAQLDENNVVTQVIVVNNSELTDENGNEVEAKGIEFCQVLFGANTRWVQTSYNGNFRSVYASVGDKYDADADKFVPPPLPPDVVETIEFYKQRIGKIPNDIADEVP